MNIHQQVVGMGVLASQNKIRAVFQDHPDRLTKKIMIVKKYYALPFHTGVCFVKAHAVLSRNGGTKIFFFSN